MTLDPTVTDTLVELSLSEDATSLSERLFLQVYGELRVMAAGFLRHERIGHTLQPTALVHEAWIRLVDPGRPVQWEGRAHFFGAAARAMRRILVDHARRKGARKRPPPAAMVTLDEENLPGTGPPVDIVALDDLLSKLAELDARAARVVELRVFAGLTLAEMTVVLHVSHRTVDNDWAFAKKWLRRELA